MSEQAIDTIRAAYLAAVEELREIKRREYPLLVRKSHLQRAIKALAELIGIEVPR